VQLCARNAALDFTKRVQDQLRAPIVRKESFLRALVRARAPLALQDISLRQLVRPSARCAREDTINQAQGKLIASDVFRASSLRMSVQIASNAAQEHLFGTTLSAKIVPLGSMRQRPLLKDVRCVFR